MGTIRKVGQEYVIEFYARGLKYQQKAGADKKEAVRLLKETESKIAAGEASLIVRDVDCDIFWDDFLRYAQKNYLPLTVTAFKTLLKSFTNFLTHDKPAVVKLSQVTPRVIEDYKADLIREKKSAEHVNFALLSLREIFEYSLKLGLLNDNPLVHIRFVDFKGLKPESDVRADHIQSLAQKGVSIFGVQKIIKEQSPKVMVQYASFFIEYHQQKLM